MNATGSGDVGGADGSAAGCSGALLDSEMALTSAPSADGSSASLGTGAAISVAATAGVSSSATSIDVEAGSGCEVPAVTGADAVAWALGCEVCAPRSGETNSTAMVATRSRTSSASS